jgi:hypothetical protein
MSMKRVLALLEMGGSLIVAQLLNRWMGRELETAGSTFGFAASTWLIVLLPLLVTAAVAGLGWFVLRGVPPDPLVPAAYALVGLAILVWFPIAMGLSGPIFPIVELLADPMYAVWVAAGISVIGVAGLVRWARRATPAPSRT